MKKLSRREFLKLAGLAIAGAVASQIPVKDKQTVIHGTDATLTIDGETIPMDMGGFTFDVPELEEEAIHALTVSKNTMIGKEFTITNVSPFYNEHNWFGMPVRFFPDKDSDFHFDGRIVDYDPHSEIATAEFSPSARMKEGGIDKFFSGHKYKDSVVWNEAMKDSGSWNKLFDKET